MNRSGQNILRAGLALLLVLGLVLAPTGVPAAKVSTTRRSSSSTTTRGNATVSFTTSSSATVSRTPPTPSSDTCSECCQADEVCACGACKSASDLESRTCGTATGGPPRSCCGNQDSKCSLCNADCCLGDDVCSCKGTCLSPGSPQPECTSADFFSNGNPKKTCCFGRAAERRCNGQRPPEPPEPPAPECERDCCPVGMFCSGCGQCFPDGAMAPLCGFPPGVQVSCCDDDDNPCTRCNADCCLGADQCSCKGTCVAEGDTMPECGPEDYNDVNGLPRVNCCLGDAGADRCAVVPPPPPPPPPPAVACQGDCCPEGSSCIGCGQCIRDGDEPPQCDFAPGVELSCCRADEFDTGDERCTLCNADCCLGTDTCSCKGDCVAAGQPLPECGPDDYYEETGLPKQNCCSGEVGLARCADIPRPVNCQSDCCPRGMKCSGCGECVLDSDDSLCVGYYPGAQISCCDDVGNPCSRCNEACCLGSDVCSCKGTCVAKGGPMPECGPEDYDTVNGLPLVHCCEGDAGAERCAVV